jgi:hypothetical protein
MENLVFNYDPMLNFEIGKGVQIKSFSSKIFSPLDNVEPVFEKDQGSQSTTINTELVFNENTLNETLSISAELQARYLTTNLTAQYKLDKESILDENSLTICFRGETSFGKQVLKAANTSLDATTLLNGKLYQEFVLKYGDYFCNAIERSSQINIFLTITNLSKTYRETLTKTAAASGSFETFGANLKLSLNETISNSIINNNVNISIASNGDESGFSQLKGLIESNLKGNSPTENITKVLKRYLKKFTRENSAISKYYFVPVTAFGVPSSFINWNPRFETSLKELNEKYGYLQKIISTSKTFNENDNFLNLATEIEKQKVNEYIDLLNKKELEIISVFDQMLSVDDITKFNYDEFLSQISDFPIDIISKDVSIKKYNQLITKLNGLRNDYIFINNFADTKNVIDNLYVPNLKAKKIRISIICVNEIGVNHTFENVSCQGYPLTVSIYNYDKEKGQVGILNVPTGTSLVISSITPRKLIDYLPGIAMPIDSDENGIIYFSNYWVYEIEFYAAFDTINLGLSFYPKMHPLEFCQNPTGPLKIFPNIRLKITYL